jgi:hypothetical protein
MKPMTGEVESTAERQPEAVIGQDLLVIAKSGQRRLLERPVGTPAQEADVDGQQEGNDDDEDERAFHQDERYPAEDALLGEPGAKAPKRAGGPGRCLVAAACGRCCLRHGFVFVTRCWGTAAA